MSSNGRSAIFSTITTTTSDIAATISNLDRIEPGDQDLSFLYLKLAAKTLAPTGPVVPGSPMPAGALPAISLNALRPHYKEVDMAGLSGGGWITTLYAAIDSTIRCSFPVWLTRSD